MCNMHTASANPPVRAASRIRFSSMIAAFARERFCGHASRRTTLTRLAALRRSFSRAHRSRSLAPTPPKRPCAWGGVFFSAG